MSQLWLPYSYRTRAVIEARKAVQEYDPNLDFGFNERTKQWCVYLKQGTMPVSEEADYPILGFPHGLEKVPTPDEIKKRLYETDALRRGVKILEEIERHNNQILKKYEDRAKDADRFLAEALEWGFRKMGSEKAPAQKVFFNTKEKGEKQ